MKCALNKWKRENKIKKKTENIIKKIKLKKDNIKIKRDGKRFKKNGNRQNQSKIPLEKNCDGKYKCVMHSIPGERESECRELQNNNILVGVPMNIVVVKGLSESVQQRFVCSTMGMFPKDKQL